jgi:hypothetical protein
MVIIPRPAHRKRTVLTNNVSALSGSAIQDGIGTQVAAFALHLATE